MNDLETILVRFGCRRYGQVDARAFSPVEAAQALLARFESEG